MIQFTVHVRVNPRDLTAPKKFYPFIKSSGEMNLKRISQRIAGMSTVNSGDVLAVLNVMIQVMTEEMADGNIIRLGEFGSFALSLKGEGEEKEEDVTAANVTGVSLNFRPGEDLANMLHTLKYEKAEVLKPAVPKKK